MQLTNLGIVLTKLRLGWAISLELHAVTGVGKDDAKFGPVREYLWEFIFGDFEVNFAFDSDGFVSPHSPYHHKKADPATAL